MRRGTTPTLRFSIPFDATDIVKFNLCFVQRGNICLQKALSDMTAEGRTLEYKLTEAETLAFKSGQLKVQMKVGFSDKTMVSNEITTYVENILKDGILS